MLENNIIISYLSKMFRLELPHKETMVEYLDFILPKIGKSSSSLGSLDLYTNGNYWLEINDDDNAHESILHMFGNEESPDPRSDEQSYKYSIDGNMLNGEWARMGNRSLFIKVPGLEFVMYDLVFLNEDFFILKKHGNHKGAKYLFLASENKISRQYEWHDVLGRKREKVKLEWRDIMEMLFDIHRYNYSFVSAPLIVIVIIMIIAYLSIA
jgi:hypothetical protein